MLYGPAMRPSPLFLACLVVGCGGRADESGQPIPAASSTPPTADVSPSAPAGPARSGNISLTSAGGRLAVSAHFPLAGAPAAQTLGPECISRTDATGSALESVSAGEIVVNLPSGGRTLKLSYDATKRAYEDASLEGAVAAGSPVTIRVAGTADVPAFDVTGAAAETAQLAEPLEGATLARDSTDLEVMWTPMEEPLLVVSLQIGDTTISCRFGASTGRGVVPAALIRPAVKAAEGIACVGPCVSLSVFTGHTTKVTAGAYDVFVTHSALVSHGLTLAK